MDPNETKRRILALQAIVTRERGERAKLNGEELEAVLDELDELWDALNGWVRNGGFKPKGGMPRHIAYNDLRGLGLGTLGRVSNTTLGIVAVGALAAFAFWKART